MSESSPKGPLDGIRVLEAATLFAAPLAGMFLGDYGADVIKVEHPVRVDPARGHGPSKDGAGLWFKTLARNKRLVTLDLSKPEGAELFLRLAADADVVLENFRPGTLERWGLGWDELSAANPRLVLARVTGFGQAGPYASRPGFGTLAEAMSGFAALNGDPDGPPMLPPLALADGVAALATAFAVLVALRARESTGRGQVVDLSLIEPLLSLLGPQITAWDTLGELQERTGNRSSSNAPRNVYRTADGFWVAVSASAQSIAERVLRLVGRPDLVEQPWFATGTGRAAHVDEIDAAVAGWIGARDRDEVIAAFEAAQAAIAPVYDARDLVADPQLAALGSIATVEDDDLGPLKMTNVIARLSQTPGSIHWSGRAARRRYCGCSRRSRGRCRRARAAARRGNRVSLPPLTLLYVPADRPDRVEKAFASAAHAVIVDLEDSVAPAAKAEARANLATLFARAREKPSYVRVNAGDGADLEAVAGLPLAGVYVPKVAGPQEVPELPLPIHCLIESAAGVEAAYAIAGTRGVAGISLGESDLRAETGATEAGLDWARSRIVNAAVAAGLPRPTQSVYPHIRDLEGLAASCARGRELGHLGRAAIHPAQLPVIVQSYLPTEAEVARARGLLAQGEGASALVDGSFVDEAILRQARQVIALADRYGSSSTA